MVVESFRNDLYSGYKTSEGVAPSCSLSFPFSRRRWRQWEWWYGPWSAFEADDALASAAARAAQDDPRKAGVHLHARQGPQSSGVVAQESFNSTAVGNILRDEDGVVAKFGVNLNSIPDYLAVVRG